MSTLVSFPFLILIVILQTTIFSRLNLLNGSVDLVLLVVSAWSLQEKPRDYWIWALVGGLLIGWVSAIPIYIPVIIYLGVAFLARYIQRQVWQIPILAMFMLSTLGSIVMLISTMIVLQFSNTPIPWSESLLHIVLPSALLNLLFSLPVYLIISDLARMLKRSEDR